MGVRLGGERAIVYDETDMHVVSVGMCMCICLYSEGFDY